MTYKEDWEYEGEYEDEVFEDHTAYTGRMGFNNDQGETEDMNALDAAFMRGYLEERPYLFP